MALLCVVIGRSHMSWGIMWPSCGTKSGEFRERGTVISYLIFKICRIYFTIYLAVIRAFLILELSSLKSPWWALETSLCCRISASPFSRDIGLVAFNRLRHVRSKHRFEPSASPMKTPSSAPGLNLSSSSRACTTSNFCLLQWTKEILAAPPLLDQRVPPPGVHRPN